MNNEKPLSFFELIDKTTLIRLVIGFVIITLLLGIFLIYIQAFDLFYAYSRAHEDWDLDELAMTLVATLIALSLSAVVLSFLLGRRLVAMANEKIAMERKLSQGNKLQAMGNLLGGMAHSINNHLLPIQVLTSSVLAELPKDSAVARDLEKVVSASRNASKMLRQILNFARQEEGPHFGRFCHLGKTLQDATELAAAALPGALRIKQDIAPLPHRVAIDQISMEIILLNLINNAVDAIEGQAGEIRISLETSAGPALALMGEAQSRHPEVPWVCIKISDTGKGMREHERLKMFDPFFTTKPVGKGTGLGLSETYGIVSKAGGTIEVASTLGQGTEIVLYLPALTDTVDPVTK